MFQAKLQTSLLFLIFSSLPLLCTVYCRNQGDSYLQSYHPSFTTIQSCVDKLRRPGDECVIPGGRYHEHVTVTDKHGTPEKPQVIRGNGDEYPIIDGTLQIKPKGGWVKDESGAYKAAINEDIWQLFIDGEMMTNARWPNALWSDRTVFNSSHWAKSSRMSKRGVMVDNGVKNLAGSGLNATGAMAILNIGSFNTFTAVVQSHTPGTPSFRYDDKFGPIKFNPVMNQYFLEDKLEFLDQPEEWFYDKSSKTLYVMTRDGQSPEGRDVRGKVVTYAFNVTNCSHVIFKKLTFFGATLWASTLDVDKNFINNLTLHSLNFRFPSYTRRMLQETAPARWTTVNANKKNMGSYTLWFFNNTFFGSDGAVLEYSGINVAIENNVFEYNDWTAANMVYQSGGIGTIISNGIGDSFVRNTVRFNGASSGYRPGLRATVRLNHFHHQCWGLIQNDGSSVQTTIHPQSHALLEKNWVHSSPKYGLRFDGQPPRLGGNGTMRKNVIWKCGGIMVKGDNHTVLHNLVFDKRSEKKGDQQGKKCALCVLRYVRENPVPINNNTVVMYNAADVANGGVHNKSLYPLAGSVVKYNVIANVSDQVVDTENFDFRPVEDSLYIENNVGPYSYNPKLTQYWIPGRQLYKTSTPIPRDDSTNVEANKRDTLMWLNAYGASVHRVYLGTDRDEVRTATPSSPEYRGKVSNEGNVFYLKTGLDANTQYFWRVDAEVSPSEVYNGDVWSFTTADGDVRGFTGSKRERSLGIPGSVYYSSYHSDIFAFDFVLVVVQELLNLICNTIKLSSYFVLF